MIPQTTLSRNKAQTALASSPSRHVTNARAWHALEASFVTRLLEVNSNQGLTASEVTTRRLLYGPNKSEIPRSPRITGMLILLFLSIVGFLVTAAILNAATRDNTEAFAILVVVVLGAIIGFAHMLRAAQASDAMQNAMRATVRVRRGGQDTSIKAEDLVPGDIVILTPGNIVPADARLIQTVKLRAKESVLTGKRTAVDKRVSQVVADDPIAKRQSMVYLGSTIDFGSAVAVVVATGVQTELGKRVVRDN
ncbi:MAG: cation-transporting P-type ATPase [Pyrinomonadaceae bacterium]|nr:cation-transporting P-type ATPase [Pyrinomonadaceae bacterium]